MLATLAALVLLGQHQIQSQPSTIRVLFLGNSHTSGNDLTGMVAALLRSGGNRVESSVMTGGHLDDLEAMAEVRQSIDTGRWTYVVLQGAMISSSHNYEYSQAAGIALAARAIRAGSKPLLFAEWPRRGWDESDYIYQHYEIIKRAAGGEILPICYAWDDVLKAQPRLDLWNADGNHSNMAGAYLAGCTIAYWICGAEASLKFAPPGVDAKTAGVLRESAKATVEKRKRL